MPKIVVKGKEWEYKIKSRFTKIAGPKGEAVISNSSLASKDVTPGKVKAYIERTFYT